MSIRHILIPFIFFYISKSQARMAPRMYSILAQVSGTLAEGTDTANNSIYNNKISFELLYLVRSGPTFGGRYIIEARNENQSTSGQAYGPSFGYYADEGYFFLTTYDVFGKLGNWTNGEGFELDIGYIQHIGSQLHVGGKYSARKMRYKTDITNSLAINKDVEEYFPSLVMTYLF